MSGKDYIIEAIMILSEEIKKESKEIWRIFGVFFFVVMVLAWLAAMWLIDQNKGLLQKQSNLITKQQVMLRKENRVIDACSLIITHMTPQEICQTYYMQPCTAQGELIATPSATKL